MVHFLIDEDLPRSLANVLRSAGLTTVDVRDVELRGQSDDRVFQYAVANQLTLMTGDLGFANLLTFPLGAHAGIIVVRLANELPVATVNQIILRAVLSVEKSALMGSLLIIEADRIRLRQPGSV